MSLDFHCWIWFSDSKLIWPSSYICSVDPNRPRLISAGGTSHAHSSVRKYVQNMDIFQIDLNLSLTLSSFSKLWKFGLVWFPDWLFVRSKRICEADWDLATSLDNFLSISIFYIDLYKGEGVSSYFDIYVSTLMSFTHYFVKHCSSSLKIALMANHCKDCEMDGD